jgi:hypothetical protein
LGREAGIPKVDLNPIEGIRRHHEGLRVIGPILHRQRQRIHKWWQVEQIDVRGILDVEEALLPLLA